MYTAVVTGMFSATHQVAMPDGTLEPLHGHDWSVRAFLSSNELDANGMVVDFCQAQATLDSILGQWHHGNLNQHRAFANVTPTAERVARCVFDRLREPGLLPVRRVEVTEAPGCLAIFETCVSQMAEGYPD